MRHFSIANHYLPRSIVHLENCKAIFQNTFCSCVNSRISHFILPRVIANAPLPRAFFGARDHIVLAHGAPAGASDGSARSTYIGAGAIAAVCRVASAETAVDRRARSLAPSLRYGVQLNSCMSDFVPDARCDLVPAGCLSHGETALGE